MGKTKDPAFLMYSKDWLEGTSVMMPDEKGVYIDLLCHQHQRGELPIDTKRLARMVGLSTRKFENIWEQLQHKFVKKSNKFYNEKLRAVMTERADRGHKNRITGIFASLIRTSNLTYEAVKKIKADFKVDEFIQVPNDELSERLTEWFNERLKSIEDVDASGYELNNKDSGEKIFKKPHVGEIEKYFDEKGMNGQDLSNKFFDYYEANGWKIGRNPMVDWRAACRSWIQRQSEFIKGDSEKKSNTKKYKHLT